MTPLPLPFTLEDLQRANEEWGCNCGPGAIAAIMGMTLDEVRPHMGDFEAKGYTNPTLMRTSLKRAGADFSYRKLERGARGCPSWGIVCVQWSGPWMREGVPARAAYRYTHWIGTQHENVFGSVRVFDVNAMDRGGWLGIEQWQDEIKPLITPDRFDGYWWFTHSYAVQREAARAAA